jgi:hypothetical protein
MTRPRALVDKRLVAAAMVAVPEISGPRRPFREDEFELAMAVAKHVVTTRQALIALGARPGTRKLHQWMGAVFCAAIRAGRLVEVQP